MFEMLCVRVLACRCSPRAWASCLQPAARVVLSPRHLDGIGEVRPPYCRRRDRVPRGVEGAVIYPPHTRSRVWMGPHTHPKVHQRHATTGWPRAAPAAALAVIVLPTTLNCAKWAQRSKEDAEFVGDF